MKKLFKYSFLFVLVFLFTLALVACGGNKEEGGKKDPDPTEEDWDSKEPYDVVIDRESFDAEYDIDDFKLELLKIHVYYTDDTDRVESVKKSMFDDGDLKKLESPGTKKVTLMYDKNGLYLEFEERVHIVDYSVADEGLNKKKDHDCVVKIIRNQVTNKLQFIVEPLKGVAGMQVKYVMDANKMKLSNFKFDESKGYGNVKYDEATNSFTFDFVTDKNITEETIVATCDFEGDFRFSNLRVDEAFDNKAYTITESGTTEKLYNVLYHVSKK